MKRLISIALTTTMILLSLIGCHSTPTETPNNSNDGSETPSTPEDFVFTDVIQDYDNKTESDGGEFICKDKTYEYNGNNITILKLENHTAENYAVTIDAEFLDADGKVLKRETQTFNGFPAGWENYFFFLFRSCPIINLNTY